MLTWEQRDFSYAVELAEIPKWLESLPGEIRFVNTVTIKRPPNAIRVIVLVGYDAGIVLEAYLAHQSDSVTGVPDNVTIMG